MREPAHYLLSLQTILLQLSHVPLAIRHGNATCKHFLFFSPVAYSLPTPSTSVQDPRSTSHCPIDERFFSRTRKKLVLPFPGWRPGIKTVHVHPSGMLGENANIFGRSARISVKILYKNLSRDNSCMIKRKGDETLIYRWLKFVFLRSFVRFANHYIILQKINIYQSIKL